MIRKSLAFLITLPVMLSVSWSAFAQTLSDKERLAGTWELSEIRDDSGDRSGNIEAYLNTGFITFREYPGGDSLDVYLSLTHDIWADDISIQRLIAFEVDEAADTLTLTIPLLATLPPLRSHYTFDGDADMTLVMEIGAINAFIDTIKPLVSLLPPKYAAFAPLIDRITPDEGTVSIIFAKAPSVDNVRASTSVDRADELPETSTLAQNYPNPFNPSTEIVYYLDESGPVRLEVYDMAGRLVAILVDSVLPQGEHRARFDAGGLPTGNYLYRLTIGRGAKALTKTMTLVR